MEINACGFSVLGAGYFRTWNTSAFVGGGRNAFCSSALSDVMNFKTSAVNLILRSGLADSLSEVLIQLYDNSCVGNWDRQILDTA